MKKIAIALAGLGLAAVSIPAASAAPGPDAWRSINQRQAQMEQRITFGVRNGAINYREAATLRTQFRSLERLEAQYRRSGNRLTIAERRDLDRRFDVLERRIQAEMRDRDGRGHGNNNGHGNGRR